MQPHPKCLPPTQLPRMLPRCCVLESLPLWQHPTIIPPSDPAVLSQCSNPRRRLRERNPSIVLLVTTAVCGRCRRDTVASFAVWHQRYS